MFQKISLILLFLSSTAHAMNPHFYVSINGMPLSGSPAPHGQPAYSGAFLPDFGHSFQPSIHARSQAIEAQTAQLQTHLNQVQQHIRESRHREQLPQTLPTRDPDFKDWHKDLVQQKLQTTRPISPTVTPETELPYHFESIGEFHDGLVTTYQGLYQLPETAGKVGAARAIGLAAVENSDQAYADGASADAQFYKDVAIAMLDIGIGIDPITGFGRSAFELFTGRNLITGAQLTTTERGFAFLNVVSIGGTSTSTRSIQIFSSRCTHIFERAKVFLKNNEHFQEALHKGEALFSQLKHLIPPIKAFRVTNSHTAEHINQNLFARYTQKGRPPFEWGTSVVECKTLKDSHWIRVHTEQGGPSGRWVIPKKDIHGLTPEQIRAKYALDFDPTHVSVLKVPTGTTLFRGTVQDHGLGGHGSTQYFLNVDKTIVKDWVQKTKKLP